MKIKKYIFLNNRSTTYNGSNKFNKHQNYIKKIKNKIQKQKTKNPPRLRVSISSAVTVHPTDGRRNKMQTADAATAKKGKERNNVQTGSRRIRNVQEEEEEGTSSRRNSTAAITKKEKEKERENGI
jgi:hypothetical protein